MNGKRSFPRNGEKLETPSKKLCDGYNDNTAYFGDNDDSSRMQSLLAKKRTKNAERSEQKENNKQLDNETLKDNEIAQNLIIESLQKELSKAKERIEFLEQEQQRWNDKEIGKTKTLPEYDCVLILSSDSEEEDFDDSSGISDNENQEVKLASLDSNENVAENNTIKASLKPAVKILDSEEEDEKKSESELNLEESNAKDENEDNSFIKLAEKLCYEEEEELDYDEEGLEPEENEMKSEKEISDSGESATKNVKIKSLSNVSSSEEEEEEDELDSEEENLDSSDESEKDPFCTQFIVPTSEEELLKERQMLQKEISETDEAKTSPKYDVIELSSDSEVSDDNSDRSDSDDEINKLAFHLLDSNQTKAENYRIKESPKPVKILDSEHSNNNFGLNYAKNEESVLPLLNSNGNKWRPDKVEVSKYSENYEAESDIDTDESSTKANDIEISSIQGEVSYPEELDSDESSTSSSESDASSSEVTDSEEEELPFDESTTTTNSSLQGEVSEHEESDSEENEAKKDKPQLSFNQFPIPIPKELETNYEGDVEEDNKNETLTESSIEPSHCSDNNVSDSEENSVIQLSTEPFKNVQPHSSPHHQDAKILIKQEPSWLVSQSKCNSLYHNHKEDEEKFLHAYIKVLFNIGERILPEDRLNQRKKNEILKIMAHYFMETKMEHHQNHMYRILANFRQYNRQHFIKISPENGIIGVCPNGEHFFYLKINEKYLPYTDEGPLENISEIGLYAIPKKYRSIEFITVIHLSDKRRHARHAYHLLEPATGNMEKNIHLKHS